MTHQTILMVGHGSRVPKAVAQFRTFVNALANELEQPIRHCFLELAQPDLATGLTEAARSVGRTGEVIVSPLMLGPGGHQKNDIAAAVQWAQSQFPEVIFRYTTPLEPHAKLIELLDLRVRECVEAETTALPLEVTTVLVVGRGSSDPDSNSELARTAHLLFENRPYQAVEYAFLSVARPHLAEGLQHCQLLGARQIVVAPFILFTGKVDEKIQQVIAPVGATLELRLLYAQYLGLHPFLLNVVKQRLQEALAGVASMTCDLCKYRFHMAGYEQQVGLPQSTHHLHGDAEQDHDHHHHHEHADEEHDHKHH